MFDIGVQELVVIFVVILIVFGPKRAPELGKAVAKGLNEMKRALQGVKEQVEAEFKEASSSIKETVKVGEKGAIGKEFTDFKKSIQDIQRQVKSGVMVDIHKEVEKKEGELEEELKEEELEEEELEEEEESEEEGEEQVSEEKAEVEKEKKEGAGEVSEEKNKSDIKAEG